MKTLENYICEWIATEEQIEEIEALDEFETLQVNILLHEEQDELQYALDNKDDVQIFEDMDYKDLAENFLDEWMFWDIPSHLTNYIDISAIADDLEGDYLEFDVEGRSGLYRRD